MHPVLFTIGQFAVHSYGTGVILAFVAVMIITMKRARRFGLNPDSVLNLAIVIIILWCAGARLGALILQPDRFSGNWLDFINPFQNIRHGRIGFSGWREPGGHVLGLLALLVYAVRQKLSFVTLGNLFFPGFMIAVGIWRSLACFLAGCCFGYPTETALGLVYPPAWYYFRPYPSETSVWPAQLFAAAVGFFGAALFYWLERRRWFPDNIFWLLWAYFTLARIVVDQFRYYPSFFILGRVGPLTFNVMHIVFGGIFLLSAISLLWCWSRRHHYRFRPKAAEIL